jgi:hypothetical protein
MVLNMSKSFVIGLIISIIFALGMRDPNLIWKIMVPFIIIRIIWKVLTGGSKGK